MVSFLFSWLLLFLLCAIKINFLQYTWELQKYKSKYFTAKKTRKKTRKPCLRTIKDLRTSELPLSKFQCLKMQDFGIPLFTQKFFCLPQYLTNS